MIKWRPVLWGLCLQYWVAFLIMRTPRGIVFFKWLSGRIEHFLSFADAGALFLFGGHLSDISNFAFGVLPIIIYFSVVINVLYYIGVMDFIIRKVFYCLKLSVAGGTNRDHFNTSSFTMK